MADIFAERRQSKQSLAESTKSDASNYEPFENPRASMRSSYVFGVNRKTRQSLGAYSSLFARKLLPPLGFYREAEKYVGLKLKFVDDPYKLDALDEMWEDYHKYQNKFFWTTGYYADYQKNHRATKLRKPGEDSSDEEFIDPAGMYMVAGAGQGGEADINVEEFERYREAKKGGKAATFDLNQNKVQEIEKKPDKPEGYLVDRRPTTERLFDDTASKKGKKGKDKDKPKDKPAPKQPPPPPPPPPPKEVEEVETIVEYTLIRDPNKKKRKSTAAGKKDKPEAAAAPVADKVDGMNLLELQSNKKVVTRRKSVSLVDPATGQLKTDVKETTELQDKSKKPKGKK